MLLLPSHDVPSLGSAETVIETSSESILQRSTIVSSSTEMHSPASRETNGVLVGSKLVASSPLSSRFMARTLKILAPLLQIV